MFDTDELHITGTPDLIAQLRRLEREIGKMRAQQLYLLREVERRSSSRSRLGPAEIAGHLDVATDTARALLDAAARTPERSDRMAQLERGDWSFDRAVAIARLFAAGADDATMHLARERDIAGIHQLRALTRRIRRRDEREAHEERFVRFGLSLDESVGFISGQLSGHDWHVVHKALDHRADRFPPEARSWTREQRRADALVAIAQDWLDGRDPGATRDPGTTVTILVDAETASRTDCEAGVAITAGPRIGPDTLDRLMCEGTVEIVVDHGSGRPIAVGPSSRVVPPKVRRFVLDRDGGCTIDGCAGRYRLEVHHIVPRSEGGTHDATNLTTLCWWHHHVGVHLRGHRIDPDSPARRRRITADATPP